MKTNDSAIRRNQTLQKVGQCLYRSNESNLYYAIFKRGGKQVKRSLKTTDKALAHRLLGDLRQKVTRLKTASGSKLMFSDLAERWLGTIGGRMKPSSRQRRETAINALTPHFKTLTIRSITKGHVERWAAARSSVAAARTFNIERETLMQIFRYAVDEGLLLENPVATIKRQKQEQTKAVIPTKAQFKTLLNTLNQMDVRYHEAANLCELLAYTGCRLGEATAMTWGDVEIDLNSFTITGGDTGTKNHEERTVPLFPSLATFLIQLRDALTEPPKPTDRIIRINDAKKAIATACAKANLPHFNHHCLRHFFCSNAIEAGVDFKTIAGWLGHKDGGLLVAKTYGHLRDEHSAAMAKRMIFNIATDIPQPDNVVKMGQPANA